MQAKILLFSLAVLTFSSCSTAYKSGQTPDDVYYSPVNFPDKEQNNDRVEVKQEAQKDYEITMRVRDYRWRSFNDDYEYRNSPWNYYNCKCNSYGYYYNPVYHPWPVYISKYIPVNTTPRMVNLNAYRGYSNISTATAKSTSNVNWVRPSVTYNNSNNNNGGFVRRVINAVSNSGNSSSNNSRTYTPSSSSNSGSSSSGSNKSSGTVSRPSRGG